jgi:phosphoribosylformylglycinamidine cyclo-ligase
VSHCVNDILVQGARPLFFLDYVAMGKLDPGVLAAIIEGIARACRENGTALLGGETAEMPGFYPAGEYDVAGTIVGAVERARILDGTRVRQGDVAIGLPSAGLHTNGYSLARRILFEDLGNRPGDRLKELGGRSIAEVLLAPHRSYLRALEPLLEEDLIHAMAHITGGGFYDNIPRVLPGDLDVRIRAGSWPVLPIFELLERDGKVSREEMHRVFNMGIGMVLLVAPEKVPRASDLLSSGGEPCYFIGNVVAGRRQVLIDFA